MFHIFNSTRISARQLHSWMLFLAFLSMLLSATVHCAGQTSIHYSLSISAARSQTFHVQIVVEHLTADFLDFAIPAWTPGYYQILHYEKNIDAIQATDESGSRLAITHPSLRQWHVTLGNGHKAHISLDYDIRAKEPGMGFFGCYLDNQLHQGFVNGASAFMYLVGAPRTPVTLSIKPPEGWKTVTPLNLGDTTAGQTDFSAKDYDELIDCPIQLGKFDEIDFTVENIPFRAILVGKHDVSPTKLTEVLARIATTTIHQFAFAPFKNYVFFYHIGEEGFQGGLEHHNSTVIHLSVPIGSGNEDEFVTTTAHELFHAWNVKYLRPAGLGPFDYSQPVRTASLWWAEGITDYYASVIPYRAGLRSKRWLLDQLVERITQLDSNPSRTVVTLEEASRKSWEGMSEGFHGLSYYLKGSLIGLYFDLRIRALTDGKHSLDDVMKALCQKFGKSDIGYPEDSILIAINSVAGMNLAEEYNRYVRGTDEIPWEEVLTAHGLELTRSRISYVGVSLIPQRDPDIDDTEDADYNDRAVIIDKVVAGYPASRMGLKSGDRIVRINGMELNYGSAGLYIRTLPPSTPIAFEINRGGKKLTFTGETGVEFSHHKLSLIPEEKLSEKTQRLRSQFFTSLADKAAGKSD